MIVATAGHVDHGKSSLVGQLTGVDTDRLPEEKSRKLSIDLGFAYLTDPSTAGQTIGFVDVPGHEKFVKNMIAGVGSIALALLVVAADDGLMPQTVEHVAILKLMGVSRVVPVITKIDLVPASRVAEVSDQIQSYLNKQVLEVKELFAVSIHRSDTVDALRNYLLNVSAETDQVTASGQFRMAVDRSFTVGGAGTVVTGTVWSGHIDLEEPVYLLGGNASFRVRSIRAQSIDSESARAGQRCALNLAGSALRKRLPVRGDFLTTNQTLRKSNLIDAELSVVDSWRSATRHDRRVFKHWTPCHLHIGTASATCRVALLESETLAAGQSGFARIYCDKPIAAVAGDRFVLRDQSAKNTVAGGRIIDPLAPARGRSADSRLQMLNAMNHDDIAVAFSSMLALSGSGLDLEEFVARFNCSDDTLTRLLSTDGCRHEPGAWIIADHYWDTLCDKILDSLERWHGEHPLLLGATGDQIARIIQPAVTDRLATALLNSLIEDRYIVKKGAVYRLAAWTSKLDDHHEQLWEKLERMIAAAGRTAPRIVEIAESLNLSVEEVTQSLNTFVAHGRLFRVSINRYYLPEQLLELAQLGEILEARDSLTVAAFRDESTIGRNLVVELLEFFDRCQFTRRIGQNRQVLRSAQSVFG